MLSQIQPHFLYNSLTAIRQLCDIDPKGQTGGDALRQIPAGKHGIADNRTLYSFERNLSTSKVIWRWSKY